MIHSVPGRVGQFRRALAARRRPPDPAPAQQALPEPLFALFGRMPAEDRRHALAVMALLVSRGEADAALLQAALLHDVGKAEAGVRLHHRVSRVLLRGTARSLWRWLAASPTGWRRPYWVMSNHPARGAVWVETQGGDADVVALIRYHESKAPAAWSGTDLARWHEALAWADARD